MSVLNPHRSKEFITEESVLVYVVSVISFMFLFREKFISLFCFGNEENYGLIFVMFFSLGIATFLSFGYKYFFKKRGERGWGFFYELVEMVYLPCGLAGLAIIANMAW